MNTDVSYYCFPVWLSILVDGLIREGLASKLKNSGTNEEGLYRFKAGYGEETGREERLIAWSATTSARLVCEHLKSQLTTDVRMLVSMAEEYAKERNGREEPKAYRGIIQLLVARAVELNGKNHRGETLIINGDFSLIGQLPPNGRLRIIGKVERIEGSTGELLEVVCEECPQMEFRGMATKGDGAWRIVRTVPNCVMPVG